MSCVGVNYYSFSVVFNSVLLSMISFAIESEAYVASYFEMCKEKQIIVIVLNTSAKTNCIKKLIKRNLETLVLYSHPRKFSHFIYLGTKYLSNFP